MSYESFPVQDDRHFLTVARYVERNPLRAKLVRRAENWQWGSLWRREKGSPEERGLLSEWPVRRPTDWAQRVNEPQTHKELAEVRESIKRGRPFGDKVWQARMAEEMNLQASFRPRGRPTKGRE